MYIKFILTEHEGEVSINLIYTERAWYNKFIPRASKEVFFDRALKLTTDERISNNKVFYTPVSEYMSFIHRFLPLMLGINIFIP